MDNNLFTQFQHAYRVSHSTATALTQMVDDCFNFIDKKNVVGAVLLDFSSAFDLLDHELLLEKLELYGFSGHTVGWFASYLSNRAQCVFYNGSFSLSKELQCGVPQGSCLGPLLFSIFTNDLPLVLDHAKAVMYADDTTIYLPASTADTLSSTLDRELKSVAMWAHANKLLLNTTKTKSILFASSWNLKAKPQLKLSVDGTMITQVEETKLLGVIIDSRLQWSKHIEHIVSVMGRELSVIRRCANYIPQHLLPVVIKTVVLSHLQYCPMVWSSAPKKDVDKLQFVQNKAARLSLNCSRYANIQNMHQTLGWALVKHKIHFALICFFKKILVSKLPMVLYDKLQFSCSIHNFGTRHAGNGNFTLPICHLKTGQKAVMFRGMRSWNSLPVDIANITNISVFKKTLWTYCNNFK